MKKLIVLSALLLAATIMYAQEIPAKSVPLKIQDKVKDVFPEVRSGKYPLKWEKEGSCYKAIIYASLPSQACAVIDTLLNIVRVEKKVGPESVPPKAMEYLKSQYKDMNMEITEVYMISTKKEIYYRTKLIVKPVYIFDSKGEQVPLKDAKSLK